jgi:thymidylate kinase
MSSLELLKNRFRNEEEQNSILRIIYYYMKILSNYINYHAEFGSVKIVINAVTPFKQSFREIMYQLQTM